MVVLEYILAKKGEYSRKLKEYERQRKREENEEAEGNATAELRRLENFIRTETTIVSTPSTSTAAEPGPSSVSSISNMTQGR